MSFTASSGFRGSAVALLCGVLLASCAASVPTTTKAAPLVPALEPQARVGQIRHPTLGPQGSIHTPLGSVKFSTVDGILHNSPIFDGDFADPSALDVDGSLYFYASDTTTANIPVIVSGRTTGFGGHYLGDALPTLPKWTYPGFQWGPAVWARPDGTYVLYYSTPDSAPSASCIAAANKQHEGDLPCDVAWGKRTRQCISAATSSNPAGPFVDHSTAPFICPVLQGGAIDPAVFVTSAGTPYLLWKSDGNGYGLPTIIYSQQLAPDGLTTVGPAHKMIGATQRWEGNLVEGPAMVEAGGTYWLFYSANNWDSANYAIGVAKCASVIGPCTKPFDHPFLSSTSDDQGPGGETFFDAFGLVWMVHHGWLPGQADTPNGQRRLYLALLIFPDGKPQLAPRSLSAALAELGIVYNDPTLPHGELSSYVSLLHDNGGALASDSIRQVTAYGATACTQLGDHVSLWTVISNLEKKGLDEFRADLVTGAAAEYMCSSQASSAISQLQTGLNSQ
jgi:hypothetical protein